MIKKFLVVLFIFIIVLINKGHERLEPNHCLIVMCGNGGNPIPMYKLCGEGFQSLSD